MDPKFSILLILVGAALGPAYYVYATYFSGQTTLHQALRAPVEKSALPIDGATTSSEIRYEPIALNVDSAMNPLRIILHLRARREAGAGAGKNAYLVRVLASGLERARQQIEVHFARSAKTDWIQALQALEPMTLAQRGPHFIAIEELRGAIPVEQLSVEVRSGTSTPNFAIVAAGAVALIAGLIALVVRG